MEGKEEADLVKSRNGSHRTRRPYLAQHGVVVVLLLSASDDASVGTKLLATLSPILGHLLLCCEKHHLCNLFERYSFICLFNATGNLIPDHWKLESIISSCRAYSITCHKSWVEGSLEDESSVLCHARAVPSWPSYAPSPAAHVLHVMASARTEIRIYLRNNQKRRVEMKFVV